MRNITDPVEKIIAEALDRSAIAYEHECDGLDFYLPDSKLFIEVKQFHSPRIAEQMSRAHNVIAIQGIDAARWFAGLIAGLRLTAIDDGPSSIAPEVFNRWKAGAKPEQPVGGAEGER